LGFTAPVEDFLLKPMDDISDWLYRASADLWLAFDVSEWEMCGSYSPEWIPSLRVCSGELHRTASPHVTARGLGEVRTAIEELLASLDGDHGLEPEVEAFIRDHLSDIAAAVDVAWIQGNSSVRGAVGRVYSDLLLDSQRLAGRVDPGNSKWQSFWTIVRRAAELVQVAGVLALPAATLQLVQMIEAPTAPAIVARVVTGNEGDGQRQIILPPQPSPSAVPSDMAPESSANVP
jgi:hypothetical protein